METVPSTPPDRPLPPETSPRTSLIDSAVLGRFLPTLLALSLALNAGLGFVFFTSRAEPDETLIPLHSHESDTYPYLSKRIFAEKQNDILINFLPLRAALREYIDQIPRSDQMGIYFEYLPSGNSIGINEKEEFEIASLIKTPLVMEVYREIEEGRVDKNTLLTVKEENLDKRFGTLWQKGAGTQLTVEEAIRLALVESDNTAANTLLSVIPGEFTENVFESLDIPTTKDGELILISPKNYSSVFRSLYLSSYLMRRSSNEILHRLTETTWNKQLAAGIPPGIKVAHKFGVWQNDRVHTDCGIVYVPDRPYLLCMMVKSEREKADEYMTHVSKMVYGYVVAVQPPRDIRNNNDGASAAEE